MMFAPPFVAGALPPIGIWNNLGFRWTLGAPTFNSSPAPSLILRLTHGAPNPGRASVQGLIEDDDSQTAAGFSLTYAVILRIR